MCVKYRTVGQSVEILDIAENDHGVLTTCILFTAGSVISDVIEDFSRQVYIDRYSDSVDKVLCLNVSLNMVDATTAPDTNFSIFLSTDDELVSVGELASLIVQISDVGSKSDLKKKSCDPVRMK